MGAIAVADDERIEDVVSLHFLQRFHEQRWFHRRARRSNSPQVTTLSFG
jgi:hypothetical protein